MTQREFEAVLEATRPRVERLVTLHMDLQLRTRFLPSDVAQSTIVEAAHWRNEFLAARRPIIAWLRAMVLQRLDDLRRANLPYGAKAPVSVLAISDFWQQLLPYCSTGGASEMPSYRNPSLKQRIKFAVESLVPSDQDLLAMAHFERLETFEIAAILGVTPLVVRTRTRRALAQFREMFQLTEPSRARSSTLLHA